MFVWEVKIGSGTYGYEELIGAQTLGEVVEQTDGASTITSVRCLGTLKVSEDAYAALASDALLVPYKDCDMVTGRIKALLKELREEG